MFCSTCKYSDGNLYLSNPPKYKCSLTEAFSDGNHCNLDVEFLAKNCLGNDSDLVEVVRCKDCVQLNSYHYCSLRPNEGRRPDHYYCRNGVKYEQEN